MFFRVGIDSGRRKRFAYAVTIDAKDIDEFKCPKCCMINYEELLHDESLMLKVVLSNNHFPDFMEYTFNKLISKMADNRLDEANITGYKVSKIEVISANHISADIKKQFRQDGYKVTDFATSPPEYNRLIICGKAMLDKKTGIILTEQCEKCGSKKYVTSGLTYVDPYQVFYINKESWDGSDIFSVEGFPSIIFCTERFVNVCRTQNLAGLVFDKIEAV